MHSSLIGLMVLVALVWRWRWQVGSVCWRDRWHLALGAFCLPPLMIVSACIAVLVMGHHGTMMGLSVSPVGCWASRLVLMVAVMALVYGLLRALRVWLQVRQYPLVTLPSGEIARYLATDSLFVAQVGFWRSALVVSQGWLQHLTALERQAILRHEQAHAHYRDPLLFFCLGMVRQFSRFLPQTHEIWEELLLLREIRADRWATQEAEPLLLAELLVKVARPSPETQPMGCIGFSDGSLYRLEQRIEALLQPDSSWADSTRYGLPLGLIPTILPLLVIGLHH